MADFRNGSAPLSNMLNDPNKVRTAGWNAQDYMAPGPQQIAQPYGAPSSGPAQVGGDYNAAGSGSDPFGYTGGSLLTPWTKSFEWGGGTAGGYTPPEQQAFGFGQFNYSAPNVGQLTPAEKFSYEGFQAPTAENYQQMDPGAAIREKRGLQALQNSAAAKGTLLTGGTMKALADYGQESASQEYGNAYDRSVQNYQLNRGNAAENFDRNEANRQNIFGANTQAALGQGQLGLQAATAGYDRNYQLARTQWQDSADAAQRAANAASSNSAASFNQAMQLYNMERGNFFENQDRQYDKLMGLSSLGLQGAGQEAAYGAQYGNNAANIYGQAGNAAAAGQAGAGQAWQNAATGIGNTALNAYYANQYSNSYY